MADICKCADADCLVHTQCERFTAPAGMWQSYFTTSPRVGSDCEMFWNNVFNNHLSDEVEGRR